MVNVADVLPARIVTVTGVLAAGSLLESEIVSPPVGAVEPMLTVPVAFFPPTTVAGFTVRAVIAGESITRVVVATIPLRLAPIVELVREPTARVLVTNVAEVFPAATVTDTGTGAALELLESFTTNPPAGAGPVRLTVPVDTAPPTTTAGFILMELKVAGLIVRLADTLMVPSLPVIATTF